MLQCGFINFLLLCGYVQAAQVSRIYIKDDVVPVRLSALELVCDVTDYTGNVKIYKSDTSTVSANDATVNSCSNSRCFSATTEGADFTVQGATITIHIQSLNRTRDQKYWFCEDKPVFIQVYALPVSIALYGDKVGGDLQNTAVTISCQISNCVFPAPQQFQWFYKKTNTQWLFYQNATPTDSPSTCTDSEKIYSASLNLPRFTVWPLQPSNVETTVTFQCRLSYPTLQSPLQSDVSGNVLYAVRVTTVTLKDGDREPSSTDTIDVVNGEPRQFTCTTSTSRPAATIVWSIGGTEKQRSTSSTYTYTPVYTDNNKRLQCQAYNIQNSPSVFSSNPVLSVKVKVTNVTLYDESSSPGTDDEIKVTLNQQKTLTCTTGDSNPVSTIVWYIDGQTRQTSTSTNFVLTPTSNDHGKRIYCKAYNIQPPEEAVESARPKLYVRVLAGIPSLTNWTSGNPEFLSGQEVTLTCRSTATRPAVAVVWKKGTATLQNVQNSESTDSATLVTVTSHATFTPQNTDNDVTVSCATSITSQTPQKAEHRISVWWSPAIPTIPTGSFPWREGQTGKRLKCESGDYGNPESDVVWSSSGGTPASKFLNFPALTKSDHGMNVTCQLKNSYTERMNSQVISQKIQLDVQYKPDVHVHVDNVERYSIVRNEGQSLTAVCSAIGNPVPTITWQGQATGVTQLVFTDIDRKDHGGYRCDARASSSSYPTYDFSNEKTLQVTVNFAPNVTVTLNKTDPTENDPLQISCNANGRPEDYTYTSVVQTWQGVVIPNEHSPSNGIIDISSVQLQDSGTYTCMVNNGIRDRNQQLDQIGKTTLLIKVPPTVLLEKRLTFAGAVGTSVNITVPFYCFPEVHTVMFELENGTEITNSSKYDVFYWRQTVATKFYGQSVELEGYVAVLHIKDEEASDFTNYTLKLGNDIGPVKEWTLEHVSESKPSVPVAFTYTGHENGIHTFSFIGGFNGGRLQTFIVQTAVQGTGNWKEQIRFNETDKKFHADGKEAFKFNVTGLGPNTYDIRILSENNNGRIQEESAPVLQFTIEKPEDSQGSNLTGAIAGGCGAAVVVIAIVAVVIFVLRRRKLQKKDGRSAINRRRDDSDSSDDEVMTENLAYVSADEVSKTVRSGAMPENLYSQPDKKKKKAAQGPDDLYSSPNKTKTDDPRSLYAMPDKKKNKKGEKNKQQKTDDVYENASELTPVKPKSATERKDNDDNVYENPEDSKPKPKKNTNKDGLIYADLTFNDQPKGQRKLVIHGLENTTEYVEVDFTKKADPLPDSDEETSNK